MRVLICGDRNWDDEAAIGIIVAGLKSTYAHVTIIEGEARGADRLARTGAEMLGIRVEKFPANWEEYGRAAGPIRNQQMLDQEPDMVIAFHDDIQSSKGTKDMVKRASKAGIPCYVISRS